MSLQPLPIDNSYARLPERMFRACQPTPVAAPRLIALNEPLLAKLDLHSLLEDRSALLEMLAGNRELPGSQPLAMAYAGHQFGGFVPQLGDGRAVLLAEVIDECNHRKDVQLKGAGRTPFSRGGDGRSPLGPVLREFIVSEAMHHLGIPTTRALAAVESGEEVWRDRREPGGVLTRVASSHIRVGTFEYFAARRDFDALKRLADFTLARHYPWAMSEDQPYLALLREVAHSQARLIAQWMGIGFVHGVMNTDNCSLSGETLDYGPCAFLDEYHPGQRFSAIDHHGRYAYDQQPMMAQWNLARLGDTLLPLIDEDPRQAVTKAETVVGEFARHYRQHRRQVMGRKFGLEHPTEDDDPLMQEALDLLSQQSVDFTLFFRRLAYAANSPSSPRGPGSLFSRPRDFETWCTGWYQRLLAQERPQQASMQAMLEVNPAIIPRNHQVEQVIQAGLKGDYAPFHALWAAIQNPFVTDADHDHLTRPPAQEEQVTRTFCGT